MAQIVNVLSGVVNLIVGVGVFVVLIKLSVLIDKLGDKIFYLKNENERPAHLERTD